jgi:hypothetical protein
MLVFACQVLQGLMGFDDKALILADKVEQWLPVAAGLFGQCRTRTNRLFIQLNRR